MARVAALILSILVPCMATPQWGLWVLSFAGYVLFIWLTLSSKRPFLFGFLWGTLYYSLFYAWLPGTWHSLFGLSYLYGIIIVPVLALPLYGIFTAGVSWAIYRIWHSETDDLLFMLAVPILWWGSEVLRSILYSGLGFADVGLNLYSVPPLLSLATFLGRAGLSAVVMLINAWLFIMLKRRSHSFPATSIVVVVLTVSVATWYFSGNHEGEDSPLRGRGLIVQNNVPASMKWKAEFQERILDEYIHATESQRSDSTELVFWPETALQFYPSHSPALRKKCTDYFKYEEMVLLAGGPEADSGSGKLYNSIYECAGGRVSSVYQKESRIPFVEYNPAPFLRAIFSDFHEKGFARGTGNVPKMCGDVLCEMAICVESLSAKAKKNDNTAILLIFSDDVWLGSHSVAEQHLATLTVKAVEERVWLAGINNSGPSVLISPDGVIVKKLEWGKKGTLKL